MDKIIMPKFVQNILPITLLVGGFVGAWTWLMYRKNKETR